AFFDAKRVDIGEDDDEQDRRELCRRDLEQSQVEQDMLVAESREDIGGEFRKRDADGGDGASLDHGKEAPAIEKARERIESLFQIDILSAGPGVHAAQLAVAESGGDGE